MESTIKQYAGKYRRGLDYHLAVCFLAVMTAIGIFYAASAVNPDTDAYWLIGTGRWIWENKTVPRINPFTYEEGLSIVVQQPLCSLLNYAFYRMGGLSCLWIAAALENLAALYCIYRLALESGKDRIRALLCTALSEIFLLAYLSTRPYLLSVCAMAVLYTGLMRYKDTSFIKACILTAAVTVWTANWQMASLYFIPCFLSCFTVEKLAGIRKSREWKKELRWFLLYPLWFICGLMNPYGLSGFLYLPHSSAAVKLLKNCISELRPPSTMNGAFITALAVLVFLLYGIFGRKNIPLCHILLSAGSLFCTFISVRNTWMSILSFAVLYPLVFNGIKSPERDSAGKFRKVLSRVQETGPETEKRKEYKRQIRTAFITGLYSFSVMVCAAVLLAAPQNAREKVKDTEEMVRLLEDMKEEKIWTDFNSGGLALLAGHKIYIDARPELYMEHINRKKDILSGWYENCVIKPENIGEFMEGFDADYYLTAGEYESLYFLYSGRGQLAAEAGPVKLFLLQR